MNETNVIGERVVRTHHHHHHSSSSSSSNDEVVGLGDDIGSSSGSSQVTELVKEIESSSSDEVVELSKKIESMKVIKIRDEDMAVRSTENREKSNVIEFKTEEEIERNARLYLHPDVAMQRRRLVEISKPGSEDRCLDVGCGQGFLLADLARFVGRKGELHGVDVSVGMLRAAHKRCQRSILQQASAMSLPYRDNMFDLIVICQVLVYVSDPRQALLEAKRCLRPGGRLVVLDSIWSQAVWNVKDWQRQTRILRAFDRHALHPLLPMRLPGLISSTGLLYERTCAIPITGTSKTSSWGDLVAPVIASYVVEHGLVKKKDVESWLNDIETQARANRFFFNINRYVYIATKRD